MTEVLPENIKARAAAGKLPLDLLRPAFKIQTTLALAFGARKYGRYNWRETESAPVRASTYIAAMQRHLDAWASGEDAADDSHVEHLAHIAASCAILLDAQAAGRFRDDRAKLDVTMETLHAQAVMARWDQSATVSAA